jgi:hypothetical protein
MHDGIRLEQQPKKLDDQAPSIIHRFDSEKDMKRP